MASSFLSEGSTFTKIPGESTLIFLLERGLEHIQRGCYAEGAAFLIVARKQVSSDQCHLVDALDTFIQEYVSYQHIQQAHQKISIHFAEAAKELQSHSVALGAVLPTLIKEMMRCPHSGSPSIDLEKHRSSPSQPFDPLPQHPQEQSSSQPSPSSVKEDTPLPELFVTCFGRFEVRRLGKPIALCASRNGQRILRYLVARSGHYATSDTLQTLLWPDDEPEVAQRKLHIAISALRRSLNDGTIGKAGQGYIVCKNHVYYLDPAVILQTDVNEFLSCYQAGQQKSEERIAYYEKACRLYTGPFLPEDIYADWSSLQREQLSNIYLTMCKVLTDHYFQIKHFEDAARWATVILTENRYDEDAHRQLIRIYAAQGRRHEALQQYQRCERLLGDELGVQPLPETLLVLQHLLTSEASKEKI